MPARAPTLPPAALAQIGRLGQRLRERRQSLGLTATEVAEAAGLSRMTLHRVEKGEPSVTLGSYVAVAAALGEELILAGDANTRAGELEEVELARYPVLRRLTWHAPGLEELTPQEAYETYVREWRHVDPAEFSDDEASLVKTLTEAFGGGQPLV